MLILNLANPYYYNKDVHNFGNTGLGGLLHASVSPLFTKFIDFKAYNSVNIREKVYEKLKLLRSHGITKDSNKLFSNHGSWYYEMQNLGYNYRLPDIQCALGISQLKRATFNIEKRREIAKNYINNLNGLPISIPKSNYFDGHAFHLFVILTDKRLELYNYLRGNKIFTQIHYIPIHQMPFYKEKYGKQTFKSAEKYYENCISLPIYPSLDNQEQDYIIDSIKSFYEQI